jgi:GTPase SAR1 family protein
MVLEMFGLHRNGRPGCPVLLVGNKWDMDRDGGVIEEAQAFALEHGFKHIVTSAKTGERVLDAFAGISRLLLASHLAISLTTGTKPTYRGIETVPRETSSVFDCCKTS